MVVLGIWIACVLVSFYGGVEEGRIMRWQPDMKWRPHIKVRKRRCDKAQIAVFLSAGWRWLSLGRGLRRDGE